MRVLGCLAGSADSISSAVSTFIVQSDRRSAFRKYRSSELSIFDHERNIEPGASDHAETGRVERPQRATFGSRRIVCEVLCASLMAVIVWGKPTWAIAQDASSNMGPPAGMLTTSPLATRSTRPAGIPLGSTEIAKRHLASVPLLLRKLRSSETCSGFAEPDRPLLCLTGVGFRAPRGSLAPTGQQYFVSASVAVVIGRVREFRMGATKSEVPASARLCLWPARASLAMRTLPTARRRSPIPEIPEFMLHRGIEP